MEFQDERGVMVPRCAISEVMKSRNLSLWQNKAEKRLKRILSVMRSLRGLKTLTPAAEWKVEILMVGQARMKTLNRQYRGKDYSTDVLSFYTPDPLYQLGFLGELVVCLPILQSQSKKLNHADRIELDVLIVHGILHLLHFDHEKSQKEAVMMAQWELKCLMALGYEKDQLGLIDRSGSGRRKV